MDIEGLASLEVRPEAMRQYNDEIRTALERIRVWHGDCSNHYRCASGRIVTQYPHGSSHFRAVTATADPHAYLTQPGLTSLPADRHLNKPQATGAIATALCSATIA